MQSETRRVGVLLSRFSFVCGLALWASAAALWAHSSTPGTRALAQAVPIQTTFTNPYWAGWIATDRGPFSAIRATWSVPRVPCSLTSRSDATTYVWIGEGGYVHGMASNLIQAGTASDCLGGVARYHAFFEWYPGIFATDFPLTVHPGDSISARIEQTDVNYWTLTVRDETTGVRSTTATFYSADTGSAEFVVERPTLCTGWSCGQVALARFGQVTFSNAQTWSAPANAFADVSRPQPIELQDPATARVLAQPGRTGSSADALSVLWRRA